MLAQVLFGAFLSSCWFKILGWIYKLVLLPASTLIGPESLT